MKKENVERVKNALEVQSDLLRRDREYLLNKYTSTVENYTKFINGAASAMSPFSASFLISLCEESFSSVLETGYNKYKGTGIFDQLSELEIKRLYLIGLKTVYEDEKENHPGEQGELIAQYNTLQADASGQYEVEYKYFLMNVPEYFDQIISGEAKTNRDSRHLSTIAYIANHFSSIAEDPDFRSLIGDISRRTIRRESKEDRNPVKYRKAGRRARYWMNKREKELEREKSSQKTI